MGTTLNIYHWTDKKTTMKMQCIRELIVIDSRDGKPNARCTCSLRAVPMEETDTVFIAQKIIYKNYLPQWRVFLSNNYFLFLSPKSIFFLEWQASADPLKTGDFSTMVILWFLDVLGEEKTWFLPHETVSSIFLSLSSLNYVAMSIFRLGDRSFNEDRNHHQYAIVTALIHKN